MALFRPPLALNRTMDFFKLMGCGKNGSFDLKPDWQQYAIFSVINAQHPGSINDYDTWKKNHYGSFINGFWNFTRAETLSFVLAPISSHGFWDGKKIFPDSYNNGSSEGPIAVLTRATIRPSKARAFWKNVSPVQNKMKDARGLIFSVSIGELPVIRQATFSIWESEEAMKGFAYQMQEHRDVIRKTRDLNWYSEEMFTRFRIISSAGSLNGINPLNP